MMLTIPTEQCFIFCIVGLILCQVLFILTFLFRAG